MSETISIGGLGASYWAYMANVMAECLTEVIRARRVESDLAGIPKGVFSDAEEFFRLALQATGDTLPDNPPDSISAYMIASDSIRRSSIVVPQTSPELGKRLEEYSSFLDRLKQQGELSDEDVALAVSLQKFFLRLAQDGETEAYEHSFCSLALPTGFRVP